MATVWKIGSRWSDNGSWSSRIISIFRRSNVVFLGSEDVERFNREVKTGDYFAIADGYTIPAVAKAVSDPMPLNDMIKNNLIKVRKGDPFDLTEDYSGCYGVKVKIVDLPDSLHLYYEKRGTFFRANSIADKVIKLYEDNLSNQFDIKAQTYRIWASVTETANDDKSSIIDGQTIYNIPVYQREYSWGVEQVSRFVSDIFKGFWGSNDEKAIVLEPIFIGTMQLSYKKRISENEFEQDVIDGQQRLSTILCILKYLKLEYPQIEILQKINLDWLETRVNNGKEETNLEQMLLIDDLNNIQDNENFVSNNYLRNLQTIKETFLENTKNEEGNMISLFSDNIQKFVDYFLNSIYFVVVETLAGLSKTIQIFNTINTAGLDLNGNDLFKVRMYEYLHDYENQGEEAFNEIGNIYKSIKDLNSEWRKNHDWDVVSVEEVRTIYKCYLISKYRLSKALYSKATDTFFDELFDTLLNVQTHEEFAGLKNKRIELSLNDLNRIVKVARLWNSSEFRTSDEYMSYTLVDYSRYSRYLNIAYQILLTNENLSDDERLSQVYSILAPLSKLFFCYSIRFAKAVNDIHSFMHDIYRDVYDVNSSLEGIVSKIQDQLQPMNNDSFRNDYIGGAIADNRVWKNLICLISDYFDELDNNTPLEELKNLLNGGFDIEHIHANANENEGQDIDYSLQNSIGNLMLLEYDINRSIGCLPFKDKVNRTDGKLCYKDSNYATVKKIMSHELWSLEEVIKRREEEIQKISQFLFGLHG